MSEHSSLRKPSENGIVSLKQKLATSQREQSYLRLLTDHPGGDAYDGIVVHQTADVVVLREMQDFEADGLLAVPRKHLTGHRDGRFERCANAIVKMNKAQTRLRVPRWLPGCGSLQALVAALQARDIWPAVEVLFADGTRTATYLGIIQQIDDAGFVLKGYGASGVWEKRSRIDFADVFRLEFDSRYCNHFNAYMKSRPARRHARPSAQRRASRPRS